MIRNLKVLGLAFAAVFAMTAVVASSATAHYEFTSPSAGTTLTGEQVGTHTFTTGGQTIQCVTATFEGETTAAVTEEVTITPTYAGCTYAAGAKTADVTMNGCTYILKGKTTGTGHGEIYVECPAGKVIEVHLTSFNGAETCTLTIHTQAATQGYTATNNGHHVDIHATGRVTITPHGKGGCPLLVTGVYTGTTTVRGFSAKPHVLGTAPTGNQVNLDVHS